MKKRKQNLKKLNLNKIKIANIAEKDKVSGGTLISGNDDCLSAEDTVCWTGNEETGNNITFNDAACNAII